MSKPSSSLFLSRTRSFSKVSLWIWIFFLSFRTLFMVLVAKLHSLNIWSFPENSDPFLDIACLQQSVCILNWENIWGMSSFSFVHPKKIEKWRVEKGVIVPYHHFISSLVRLTHSSWSVFSVFSFYSLSLVVYMHMYMYNATDFQVACPFHPVIFYSPFTAKNGMPSAIVSCRTLYIKCMGNYW